MKVHTCKRCGADVEMWIKPGTNWQCQCYAWNIFQPLAADQKTVAERQWQKPKLAPKPQRPCDHGLFSDEANQLDLVEMFQDPTNGERAMFYVTMQTDNAAFEGGELHDETARILKEIALQVEQGKMSGKCRDINGNTVGNWMFEKT